MTELEACIRLMTKSRDGAYPRPWTTDTDPEQADVLIVGASSAKTFHADDVGDHDQFLDALWNRNGRTCRAMYAVATEKPSKTRPNLDQLSMMLAARRLTSLQTNVTCASARYDDEVLVEDRAHGAELFKAVLTHVPWRAIIVYGVNATERFGRAVGKKMPPVPSSDASPVMMTLQGRPVYVSPTLAFPAYSSSVWAYLERVLVAIEGNETVSPAVQSTSELNLRVAVKEYPVRGTVSSGFSGTPVGFNDSAANQLVRHRMQTIAEASNMMFDLSTYQATLTGGPELSSTSRVFRHKYKTAKPSLLLREDVFSYDVSLRGTAHWKTHTNPVFQAVRTDDLQLLNRILDAVEAFVLDQAT